MLSLQFIRENPDLVRQALEKRHDSAPIDEILVKDEARRELLQRIEKERAAINSFSERIGLYQREI